MRVAGPNSVMIEKNDGSRCAFPLLKNSTDQMGDADSSDCNAVGEFTWQIMPFWTWSL